MLAEALGVYSISEEESQLCFDIFCDGEAGFPIDHLGDAVRACGFNPSDARTEMFKNQYDKNADGIIEQAEWNAVCNDLRRNAKPSMLSIESQFRVFAKGAESVSTEEITHVMTKMGNYTPEETKAMLSVIDKNNDGNVDYMEFQQMLR